MTRSNEDFSGLNHRELYSVINLRRKDLFKCWASIKNHTVEHLQLGGSRSDSPHHPIEKAEESAYLRLRSLIDYLHENRYKENAS